MKLQLKLNSTHDRFSRLNLVAFAILLCMTSSTRTAAGLIVIPIILHLIMRAEAEVAGVPGPAVHPEAARHQPAAAAPAAPAAVAAPRGGDRPAGPGPGPAEHQVLVAAGQPGGARGGGPDLRRRPAHAISPREEDPPGSGPGNRPMAPGPIAAGKPDRGLRFGHGAAELRRRSRPEQAADRAAGNRPQPAVAEPDRQRGRRRCCKKSDLPAKEIYVFTDLSRASWRADETAKLQDRLHELPRRLAVPDRRGRDRAEQLRPGRPAPLPASRRGRRLGGYPDRRFLPGQRRPARWSNSICSAPTARPQKKSASRSSG